MGKNEYDKYIYKKKIELLQREVNYLNEQIKNLKEDLKKSHKLISVAIVDSFKNMKSK